MAASSVNTTPRPSTNEQLACCEIPDRACESDAVATAQFAPDGSNREIADAVPVATSAENEPVRPAAAASVVQR